MCLWIGIPEAALEALKEPEFRLSATSDSANELLTELTLMRQVNMDTASSETRRLAAIGLLELWTKSGKTLSTIDLIRRTQRFQQHSAGHTTNKDDATTYNRMGMTT